MDKPAPADRLACIGHDVSLAAPAEKLATFVDRADTFGKLVRKGFFNAAALEQKLWDVAQAYNLSGQPGSEAEEYIADVINKGIGIDNERATNGHDNEPPPHTEIPESADTDRDREPPRATNGHDDRAPI